MLKLLSVGNSVFVPLCVCTFVCFVASHIFNVKVENKYLRRLKCDFYFKYYVNAISCILLVSCCYSKLFYADVRFNMYLYIS